MMQLKEMRDYIASLGIAEDEHCYCGKMADKKEKSIGVYPLKQRQPLRLPLGGMENASYGIRAVSILVHWNRSPSESEQAAFALHEALISCREMQIQEHRIKFVAVGHEEPILVDTDENGIYEYVIECLVYYERQEKI